MRSSEGGPARARLHTPGLPHDRARAGTWAEGSSPSLPCPHQPRTTTAARLGSQVRRRQLPPRSFRGRWPRPGSVVVLGLRPLDRGIDLGLGLRSANPLRTLDRLAGLEVLVGLEEVLDLQAVELRHVEDVGEVGLAGIRRRNGEDLVVPALLVGHPEHADGAAGDQAPRKGRLLEQHQGIERVAVLPEGVLDVAVVGRISGGGEEHPVQADAAGGMVQLVLVSLALRDFYRHVELHALSVAYGGPARSAEVALWGVGTIASTGSTIITAKTGRLKRRIALGVIALVVLLVGGGVWLGGGFDGGNGDTVDRIAVADAKLPELGDAKPVLASLATDATAPQPGALAAPVRPLLLAPP